MIREERDLVLIIPRESQALEFMFLQLENSKIIGKGRPLLNHGDF